MLGEPQIKAFAPSTTMLLADLPCHTPGTVHDVCAAHNEDAIAERLRDLGFVSGEHVKVVTRAPFGGDPLVVQIGFTRFALRRAEAARILVLRDEHLRS